MTNNQPVQKSKVTEVNSKASFSKMVEHDLKRMIRICRQLRQTQNTKKFQKEVPDEVTREEYLRCVEDIERVAQRFEILSKKTQGPTVVVLNAHVEQN